jgi:hypothetical protein
VPHSVFCRLTSFLAVRFETSPAFDGGEIPARHPLRSFTLSKFLAG